MIVFSRPPGRKRRAGDVWTSSSGVDALRRPRKTTLRAALRALRTSSRGPCDGLASRRTTLQAEQPARPSDVSSSYENKYLPRPGRRRPANPLPAYPLIETEFGFTARPHPR